jgi:hypothetical protein
MKKSPLRQINMLMKVNIETGQCNKNAQENLM